jgi:hypothetical protein
MHRVSMGGTYRTCVCWPTLFESGAAKKSIPLDMANIEKTFATWCKSYSAR